MGMGWRIATDLLDAILADARAEPGLERCGLLYGGAAEITGFAPARNVAADPRRRFEVDPAALLAAHRATRRGGPAIVGCYHSHPSGPPEPSAQDAAHAEPNGWLWLIVSPGDARLWRAVASGGRHGRFDPAALACADPPASPQRRG